LIYKKSFTCQVYLLNFYTKMDEILHIQESSAPYLFWVIIQCTGILFWKMYELFCPVHYVVTVMHKIFFFTEYIHIESRKNATC
jgi:hypothetical protein